MLCSRWKSLLCRVNLSLIRSVPSENNHEQPLYVQQQHSDVRTLLTLRYLLSCWRNEGDRHRLLTLLEMSSLIRSLSARERDPQQSVMNHHHESWDDVKRDLAVDDK